MKKAVTFPTDSEGFLTQECPTCVNQFRVKFGTGAPGPIAHCPYCGHQGLDCWWTTPQVNYLNQEIERLASDVMRKALSGPGWKFTQGRISNRPPPTEVELNWKSHQFKSGEIIKYQGSAATLRCPVTGTVENVDAN